MEDVWSSCYKKGKPHKMEARYDEIEMEKRVSEQVMLIALAEERIKSFLVRDVYVKDVCVRCGKEVKRQITLAFYSSLLYNICNK